MHFDFLRTRNARTLSTSAAVFCVLMGGFLSGCQKAAPDRSAEKQPESAPATKVRPTVLGTDQASTPAALFDTVRVRARRGDTLGLARLLVDDSVFRTNVYPVSPAYDSVRESVFQFVLGMHKANSGKGFKRLLFDAANLPSVPMVQLPLLSGVKTRDGIMYTPADYKGEEEAIQVFGTILCRANGCQVVSYAPAGLKSGQR